MVDDKSKKLMREEYLKEKNQTIQNLKTTSYLGTISKSPTEQVINISGLITASILIAFVLLILAVRKYGRCGESRKCSNHFDEPKIHPNNPL